MVGLRGDDGASAEDHCGIRPDMAARTKGVRMSSIAFDQLTKRYGQVCALDAFSADVPTGRVTAFLGANGSGKTTSMRVLLGLSTPNAGQATIGGRTYTDLKHPLRIVGAVLDQGFHPNRSARNHLRVIAAQAQVHRSRIDMVLDLVELTHAAGRRVGGFSLGMRQRLALASALIGDPAVLVLDEPFNGLDPAGIQTMRAFLREFADRGGTVFLSSHLLAEVAHSADEAIIIDHGRLVSAGPVSALAAPSSAITVTSLDADLLAMTMGRRGVAIERNGPDQVTITGASRADIGRAAVDAGVVITDMRALGGDLAAAFKSLIHQEATS
jgi:ABC-2 type transport system ATP-binding protein